MIRYYFLAATSLTLASFFALAVPNTKDVFAARCLTCDEGDGGGGGGGNPPPPYTGGYIVLYEGNYGSQNIVQTFLDQPGQNSRVNPNDEARSLKLLNVRAGAYITVFDSKDRSYNDDYFIIRVLKKTNAYTVNTFNSFNYYRDEFVEIFPGYNNGLDGKVSSIKIE